MTEMFVRSFAAKYFVIAQYERPTPNTIQPKNEEELWNPEPAGEFDILEEAHKHAENITASTGRRTKIIAKAVEVDIDGNVFHILSNPGNAERIEKLRPW